jgi:flagellar motor switch protein FliN/FliY
MAALPTLTREVAVAISEELWEEAGGLPCLLTVDLAVRKFSVRDLLQLEPGTVLESVNASGSDVPVIVNTQLIGWAEFEVVGQRLAVRLTELA